MNPVLTYSAANSMLGALRRHEFTPEAVFFLTEAAGLDDCIARLRKTFPYLQTPDGLRGGVGQTLREIECSLTDSYHRRCRKLMRFLPAAAAQLLRSFLLIRDFGIIKRIFRLYAFPDFTPSADMIESLRSVPGFCISPERIPRATSNLSIENLLEITSGTPLSKSMKRAMAQYKQKSFLYFFEIVLDVEYLKLIAAAAANLHPRERDEVQHLILDPFLGLKELTWALRMRFYHQMDSNEITYFLPFISAFFSRKHFNAIMQPGTEREAIAALPESCLAGLLGRQRGTDTRNLPATIEDLDILAQQRLYRITAGSQANRSFTLSKFLSFVIQQRLLLDDMIAVFQAKRFAMSTDELRTVFSFTEGAAA